MKRKTVLHITPDEVMKLAEWWNLDDIAIVEELDKAVDEMFSQRTLLQSRLIKLLIVWNAGRIQGIREVRRKGK